MYLLRTCAFFVAEHIMCLFHVLGTLCPSSIACTLLLPNVNTSFTWVRPIALSFSYCLACSLSFPIALAFLSSSFFPFTSPFRVPVLCYHLLTFLSSLLISTVCSFTLSHSRFRRSPLLPQGPRLVHWILLNSIVLALSYLLTNHGSSSRAFRVNF